MKVFTIWTNDSISDSYMSCLQKTRIIYPDIFIENLEVSAGKKHPGLVTDKARIEILTTKYRYEDALYVDMDCIIKQEIDFSNIERPAFGKAKFGLDYWCIYKPKNSVQIFDMLLNDTNWEDFHDLGRKINEMKDQFVSIEGFPTNKYLEHKYLGVLGGKFII